MQRETEQTLKVLYADVFEGTKNDNGNLGRYFRGSNMIL